MDSVCYDSQHFVIKGIVKVIQVPTKKRDVNFNCELLNGNIPLPSLGFVGQIKLFFLSNCFSFFLEEGSFFWFQNLPQ
jgi:hypothetical protein